MALTYGETEIIYNENGILVIGRKYFDSAAIIVLSKALNTESVFVAIPQRYQTDLRALRENGIRLNSNQIEVQASNTQYQVFFK
jgi:hypothetical protein